MFWSFLFSDDLDGETEKELSKKGEKVSARLYDWQRWQLGIAEKRTEMAPEKAIPLEYSLHHFGSFSFNKGCYLGQELMARVFHTGVLRKKVFPVLSASSTDLFGVLAKAPRHHPSLWLPDRQAGDLPSTFPLQIKNEEGTNVGTLVCGDGPLGLAQIRLEEISLLSNKTQPSLFVTPTEGDQPLPLLPVLPSWFAL